MKKTKEQKAVIRRYKMMPIFWTLIGMNDQRILVANVLTGEVRVLET